jgi:hypothetical protein
MLPDMLTSRYHVRVLFLRHLVYALVTSQLLAPHLGPCGHKFAVSSSLAHGYEPGPGLQVLDGFLDRRTRVAASPDKSPCNTTIGEIDVVVPIRLWGFAEFEA